VSVLPEQPPSYDSLYGQVKAAKAQSSGVGDFLKKFFVIIFSTSKHKLLFHHKFIWLDLSRSYFHYLLPWHIGAYFYCSIQNFGRSVGSGCMICVVEQA